MFDVIEWINNNSIGIENPSNLRYRRSKNDDGDDQFENLDQLKFMNFKLIYGSLKTM